MEQKLGMYQRNVGNYARVGMAFKIVSIKYRESFLPCSVYANGILSDLKQLTYSLG